MTITIDGHTVPFHLYPPEHWMDVAKSTRENLQAMRARRQQKLQEAQAAGHPHARIMEIHAHFDTMEKNLANNLAKQIKTHQKWVKLHPQHKDFRWSRSDPPDCADKDRINPIFRQSAHNAEFMRKRLQPRAHQVFEGRKLEFT